LSVHTLVLGIGNTLLTDEGAGIHVIRYLQTHHPAPTGAEYLDGGTLSFTLAEPIAAADGLIVVDAMRLDAPPGSLRVFENAAMDRLLLGKHGSVHEVSLADLLDMARLTGDLPPRRCLIGIQPDCLDWGDQPTAAVAAAVEQAAAQVRQILRRWHGGSSG
jgi:hydrogenase maturation protease